VGEEKASPLQMMILKLLTPKRRKEREVGRQKSGTRNLESQLGCNACLASRLEQLHCNGIGDPGDAEELQTWQAWTLGRMRWNRQEDP